MISSPAPKEYWVKREGNICWTKNGFFVVTFFMHEFGVCGWMLNLTLVLPRHAAEPKHSYT